MRIACFESRERADDEDGDKLLLGLTAFEDAEFAKPRKNIKKRYPIFIKFCPTYPL
jgi:hypothetical protein